MMRKMGLLVCVFTLCAGGSMLVARAESVVQEGEKETFKPVASIDSLMRGQEQQFDALTKLLGTTGGRGRTAGGPAAAALLAEVPEQAEGWEDEEVEAYTDLAEWYLIEG